MRPFDPILTFWFGAGDDPYTVDPAISKRWFTKRDATDTEIRTRFLDQVLAAARGDLDDWRNTPHGRLALLILLDQFPRNIFRNTPFAFAADPLAQALALDTISQGLEQALRPIERLFVFIPLEHAEDIDLQNQCIACFERLIDVFPDALRHVAESYLDYGRQHHVIIERFGRFPHRNALLGRSSTADELAFLSQPGSSF